MKKNSSKSVQNNGKSEKKLGGVTGKGFMPGQSGNPGGRPKKKELTVVFEEMLAERLDNDADRQIFKDTLWQKLLGKGVMSVMLLERVLERTEGKLTQPLEVSGEIDIMRIIEEGRKRAKEGA